MVYKKFLDETNIKIYRYPTIVSNFLNDDFIKNHNEKLKIKKYLNSKKSLNTPKLNKFYEKKLKELSL